MNDDLLNKALRYRWLIFLVLSLGYILVYFHRNCMGVVTESMMQDLVTSGAAIGVLGSAYFYTYALMQLPAGLLSDSWGPRRTITVFFMVAAVGSMVMAKAPNIYWAIAGRTLVGIGVSMLFVPTMKVFAEWFKIREFASMTGILVLMGGVGSITATRPLEWLADAVGWRKSFAIVGMATAVLGALVWAVVRDRPSDKGWPDTADPRDSGEAKIGLAQGVKTVLSNPYFWPLALWFFFECAAFFAFIAQWGGPYFSQVYHVANPGGILMWSAFGMIVASPLHGFVSDRVIKRRKPSLVGSAFITMLVTATLALFTDALPVWSLYLVCLLMGAFANAVVVIGFTAAKELFPVQIAGTSTGLVNFFPFMGAALLQPLMGKLLDLAGKNGDSFTVAGYRHAFVAMMACGVAAFVASLFVKETLKRGREEEA